MNKEYSVESDCKNNKIKEGFLMKRSRILKEWKKRWMVLTKTHLYSFQRKAVYKDPTEEIPLREVTTIKSFYKNQYELAQVFRVESDDTCFYMSAEDHQTKWSWMTSIEKMVDQACSPLKSVDNKEYIRETIRMSSMARYSNINNTSFKKQQNIDSIVFKKLKFSIVSKIINEKIVRFDLEQEKLKNSMFSKKKQNYAQTDNPEKFEQKESQGGENRRESNVAQLKQFYEARMKSEIQAYKSQFSPIHTEKIVYVDKVVERIVEVKVPVQIERIVERQRIVYKEPPKIQKQESADQLSSFFQDILDSKLENPKPLIDFVVFLAISGIPKYQDVGLAFSCSQNSQRFFAEMLLVFFNDEIEEQKLNNYLHFLTLIYENTDEYFYMSDLKILMDIILREIELYRSNLNQMLNLKLLNNFIKHGWWKNVKHRMGELKALAEEISKIGTAENKVLSLELLAAIHN